MPFKSESQRRFMYAKHPEIAKRWEKKTEEKALPEKVATPHFPRVFLRILKERHASYSQD